MTESLSTGTVEEEFKLGNTRIKICNDAYINRTPEEIQQSLQRINAICLKCAMSCNFKSKAGDGRESKEDPNK